MADRVTVTVVKWHTRAGIVQPVHATYEVAPDEVENLVAQGLVTVDTPATPPAPSRQYETTEADVPQQSVLTPKRKK
jgi:hypothetical protein